MEYIALHLTFCNAGEEEIGLLSAVLDELKYEGITECEDGVIAYIPKSLFDKDSLTAALDTYGDSLCIKEWETKIVEEQNWNQVWESNFDPVVIDERCVIRAPFHEAFDAYEHIITIEPKMAFGTGHHETTSLIVKEMLDMDWEGKKVLDMGCGTGILAILAHKLGAKEILGIDIDKWATDNTLENAKKNRAELEIRLGGVEQIPAMEFDVILANINRNILMDQVKAYSKALKPKGQLIISGILKTDVQDITNTFEQNGLAFIKEKEKGNWSMLAFLRN